jgi:hypothetical protein
VLPPATVAGGRTWRPLFTAEFRRRTVLTSVPWFLLDIVVYGIGVFTPTIIAALTFTDLFLGLGFVGALLSGVRTLPG